MSVQVGDILRVVAVAYFTDGNLIENVFNAVIGGTGGPYDEDDIVLDALAWVNNMWANFTSSISNELDGSEVKTYIYDSIDDDWDEVGSVGWTFNPTGTPDTLPRGVAALANARTSDPDVQGKKYIGGLTEGQMSDSLWEAGFITLMLLFAADWVTAFAGGTSGASWIPGVWSPTETNFFPMSGSIIIPTIPAYQRRRKQGVGA